VLFNSYEFIFGYVPVTLAVFFWLGGMNVRLAAAWLTAASLFFYGWWNPAYVGLLLGSICFNYVFGTWIARSVERGDAVAAKRYLVAALIGDLGLLGYYKYANFFLESVNAVAGTQWGAGEIILPLGISFFTFTQIAFLVDAYQGKVREYNFVHYGLFVTYFPHLIAGPVLHHAEMMPQFGRRRTYRVDWHNLSAGLTIFFIGLFKKTFVADQMATYASPVFAAPGEGVTLTAVDAWFGALAYALQLYFDFSGYSDMAVGLSKMIGVRLPLNFHSPYKAVNIIEFWRRWHMTLSRFLRDYLYVPLGGNRKGKARRYVNLLVTMLLGGLWHGAGWTFVIWGGLHGVYLVVNHAWRALRERLGQDLRRSTFLGRLAAGALTFLAVTVAWVFFRAEDLATALDILWAMAGGNGVVLPYSWERKLGAAGAWLAAQGVEFRNTATFSGGGQLNWTLIVLAVAWLAPNTQQIMRRARPALYIGVHSVDYPGRRWWHWRANAAWALATVVIGTLAILAISGVSEFIYFQF
jgi:D-alanyl-lipoteichoic acid acyltransferase DltB (MBOAT superfamily)